MGVIRFNFFLNQVKKSIPLCIYLVPLLWNFKGKLTFLRHWKTNITSFTLYTLPTNFVSKMSFTLSYHHEIGEKLSDIDGRLDYPLLNKELVLDVKRLWQDPAIQVKTNSWLCAEAMLYIVGNLLTWKYSATSWLCTILHGKFGSISRSRLCANKGVLSMFIDNYLHILRYMCWHHFMLIFSLLSQRLSNG